MPWSTDCLLLILLTLSAYLGTADVIELWSSFLLLEVRAFLEMAAQCSRNDSVFCSYMAYYALSENHEAGFLFKLLVVHLVLVLVVLIGFGTSMTSFV